MVTHQQAIEGKLVEVGEEKIKLEQEIGAGKHKETKIVELSFLDIDKTFVLVSFK